MNNFFDAIGIDLGILVVMLMVLVLVLIVLVLNVSLGLHRQRRRYNMFMKGADGESIFSKIKRSRQAFKSKRTEP